jgi:hypothetical protein
LRCCSSIRGFFIVGLVARAAMPPMGLDRFFDNETNIKGADKLFLFSLLLFCASEINSEPQLPYQFLL